MRRFALLLPLATLLLAHPAGAQHWNDAGPGRDLLSSSGFEFDALRQRLPGTPSFGAVGAAPQAADARGPIPIIDWVPPPPSATPAPRPRSTPRRTTRPRQDPVMRDPAPLPAATLPPLTAAPQAQPISQSDWERSFAERERELARLRQVLEQDRLRYEQARQPQLR